MDTIAKHAKKLVVPYKSSQNAKETVASAKSLARAVINNAAMLKKHKKQVLSLVQWIISEVDGKYTTRYRSKAVVELAGNEPASTERIQHDHVVPRKEITERILRDPNDVENILDEVVACVVTKSEHDRLRGAGSGWSRYKAANIVVYDMETVPPTELKW